MTVTDIDYDGFCALCDVAMEWQDDVVTFLWNRLGKDSTIDFDNLSATVESLTVYRDINEFNRSVECNYTRDDIDEMDDVFYLDDTDRIVQL